MFSDLLDDIREEEAERERAGNEKDTRLYTLFESNHPDITIPDEEEEKLSEGESTYGEPYHPLLQA